MSLVGTRPPTVDEWDKYELHHRARLATKPGLTGMWQVSGRSNITDFEEVVKLDKQYISEWTMGLDIKILSASPEGILVSDKEQSSYIKPFVETFNKQVMFAEKSWGSFRVLDVEKESLTIKVTLNPGHKMNYHSHTNRDEVWTVVSGTGYTIIDGQKQIVRPGDVLRMPAGCKHTIVADTELQVIEVQMGKDISVHDKEKFELAL